MQSYCESDTCILRQYSLVTYIRTYACILSVALLSCFLHNQWGPNMELMEHVTQHSTLSCNLPHQSTSIAFPMSLCLVRWIHLQSTSIPFQIYMYIQCTYMYMYIVLMLLMSNVDWALRFCVHHTTLCDVYSCSFQSRQRRSSG